jgi:hypothetical protein
MTRQTPFSFPQIMKRRIFLILAVFATLLSTSMSASAQHHIHFTLHNDTDMHLTAVHLSPAHEDFWTRNLISEHLCHEGTATIEYNPKGDYHVWDLKVIDEDGHELVFRDLNLDAISGATLIDDHGRVRLTTKRKGSKGGGGGSPRPREP